MYFHNPGFTQVTEKVSQRGRPGLVYRSEYSSREGTGDGGRGPGVIRGKVCCSGSE